MKAKLSSSIKKKIFLESYGDKDGENYQVNFARYVNDGEKRLLGLANTDAALLAWFTGNEQKVSAFSPPLFFRR